MLGRDIDVDLLADDGSVAAARSVMANRSPTRRGESIELIAENPDFANIVLESGRDEFSLEGIAVGLIRSSGF